MCWMTWRALSGGPYVGVTVAGFHTYHSTFGSGVNISAALDLGEAAAGLQVHLMVGRDPRFV
jgi:hypothetical protein